LLTSVAYGALTQWGPGVWGEFTRKSKQNVK